MDDHLGYEKHAKSEIRNSRNGKTSKLIKTEDGEFELDTPRDRDSLFEPKLVKKHQSRFTSMDEKIRCRYIASVKKRKAPMKLTEAITPTGHPQSTYMHYVRICERCKYAMFKQVTLAKPKTIKW